MAPRPELNADVQAQALSPLATRAEQLAKTLAKRNDGYKNLASAGSRPATDLTGPGFQVMFALIGVFMTMLAIWFFFWAKNGGFKWRGQEDWEDYKSTVLRRKGPDGKTLSNVSKSTRLGGGSVVHGGSYGAPTSIGYTDETGTSADMSEIRDAEEGKHQHGIRGGDGRRHKSKKHRRDYENDYNDPDLDGYRHEKAAKVGGLNRQADGMYSDYTPTEPSDLGSHVSGKPLVKKDVRDPKKEAKEKERRARERMKNAKAAEKEAQKKEAAEAKARKAAEKLAAKQAKKTRSEVGSEMPENTPPRLNTTNMNPATSPPPSPHPSSPSLQSSLRLRPKRPPTHAAPLPPQPTPSPPAMTTQTPSTRAPTPKPPRTAPPQSQATTRTTARAPSAPLPASSPRPASAAHSPSPAPAPRAAARARPPRRARRRGRTARPRSRIGPPPRLAISSQRRMGAPRAI
jgi:hypothetical protein